MVDGRAVVTTSSAFTGTPEDTRPYLHSSKVATIAVVKYARRPRQMDGGVVRVVGPDDRDAVEEIASDEARSTGGTLVITT